MMMLEIFQTGLGSTALLGGILASVREQSLLPFVVFARTPDEETNGKREREDEGGDEAS